MLLGCGCHCSAAPSEAFQSASASIQSFASSVTSQPEIAVTPCEHCQYGVSPLAYEVTFTYAGVLNPGPFGTNRPDQFPCCPIYAQNKWIVYRQPNPFFLPCCVYGSVERSPISKINQNRNPQLPPGPSNPARVCELTAYPIMRLAITTNDNLPNCLGSRFGFPLSSGYKMGVTIGYGVQEYNVRSGQITTYNAQVDYVLENTNPSEPFNTPLNCLLPRTLKNARMLPPRNRPKPEWESTFANTPCGWGVDDPNLPATITVRPVSV